jgi:hypothetical protein
MIYTLYFTFHGKTYTNFQETLGECSPNRYEATALGLMLWTIEHENLSREDRYVNVCLTKTSGKPGESEDVVWARDVYYPISEEVK